MSYRDYQSKDTELSEVAKQIKGLRKRDNETQEELAKAIGCKKATISNIEQGNSAPSLKIAKNIALHYNVSMDYVCGLTDDTAIPSNILDCLCHHISLKIESMRMSQLHKIPVISINKGLFDYLKVLAQAQQFQEEKIPDELINAWIEKEAEKAKNALRSETGTVKYALLSTRYIASDEMLSLLENTYGESAGDDTTL